MNQYAASHMVRYRFSTSVTITRQDSPKWWTVTFQEDVPCTCISYASSTTARSWNMCLQHVQRRHQNYPLKYTSSRFPRRWRRRTLSSELWRLLERCYQRFGGNFCLHLLPGNVFYSWSGTKSTRYCGHFWPIVQAPDDRWGWLWSNWWNEDWQGKQKYSEKTCLSATLSTTNPTSPDPGSNPGRRGGKPATNRFSYSAALPGNVSSRLQDYTVWWPKEQKSKYCLNSRLNRTVYIAIMI
jgi:hypothetical protein